MVWNAICISCWCEIFWRSVDILNFFQVDTQKPAYGMGGHSPVHFTDQYKMVKLKVFIWWVKIRSSRVYVMKLYVGLEVQLHPFLATLPRWMCEVTMRWSLYFWEKSSRGLYGLQSQSACFGGAKVLVSLAQISRQFLGCRPHSLFNWLCSPGSHTIQNIALLHSSVHRYQ